MEDIILEIKYQNIYMLDIEIYQVHIMDSENEWLISIMCCGLNYYHLRISIYIRRKGIILICLSHNIEPTLGIKKTKDMICLGL